MAQVFLGSLMLVPYNFAPKGFAFCQGQILPISQYSALFSLLGTIYGGNGTSTFALPDLQGRIPIGTSVISTPYELGDEGGVESVTLSMAQMPAHTHTLNAATLPPGKTSTANGNVLGGAQIYDNTSPVNKGAAFSTLALPSQGGNLPHENRMPTLALNWIIAMQGIFPTVS
jgi:microcystin-dependent protein